VGARVPTISGEVAAQVVDASDAPGVSGGQRRGVQGAEGHCEVDGVVEVVGDVLQRRRDAAGGAPCGCDLLVASASSFYGQIRQTDVFRR
jgi:hypothetical protein